jgi:TPR repeat protein
MAEELELLYNDDIKYNELMKLLKSFDSITKDITEILQFGYKNQDSRKDGFNKIYKYYKPLIERGNGRAMFSLGNIYLNLLKDRETAKKYYLGAIEKGIIDAMLCIYDVDENLDKRYLELAINSEIPEDDVRLPGMLYLSNLKNDNIKGEAKYRLDNFKK